MTMSYRLSLVFLSSRLYSEYIYFSKDPTPESFHDRVVERIQDFNKCVEKHSKRKCVYQSAGENGDIVSIDYMFTLRRRVNISVWRMKTILGTMFTESHKEENYSELRHECLFYVIRHMWNQYVTLEE